MSYNAPNETVYLLSLADIDRNYQRRYSSLPAVAKSISCCEGPETDSRRSTRICSQSKDRLKTDQG